MRACEPEPRAASREPIFASHRFFLINHKNYNFLACNWFKNVLFSTNSLAKLLSDSLLLDSLLLDSLLSDSLTSQSHSKMQFKSTNHIQSCNYVCVRARCYFCVFALDLRYVQGWFTLATEATEAESLAESESEESSNLV